MNESKAARHVVIGTAGHIDHGKTSLVKALTGRDLDKLREEKQRGITIELGFAFYGEHAAFVDVPGHEKLVKTMIAGASAMSAAMLVVAADDGVMPQTREHLTVLDALGVNRGIVAVTKADLVDQEWLELVVEEARELTEGTGLEGSSVVAVDSISGRGIDELKQELDRLVELTEPPADQDFFRLPIDRSFVIRGHGRIVTGTVWNGSAKSGDKLLLQPGNAEVRLRGLQAHEQPVDIVRAGDRAALNLTGDVGPERGQMLASAGRTTVNDFIDAAVFLSPGVRDLKQRARVRVHLGTTEVIGRILLIDRELLQAGQRANVRLALEEQVAAMHGDLGVLRFYSPVETLGGFRVLDPDPPDRKRSVHGLVERLEGLAADEDSATLAFVAARRAILFSHLLRLIPESEHELRERVIRLNADKRLVLAANGDLLVDRASWLNWRQQAAELVERHHSEQPNDPGLPFTAWMQQVFGHHARTDLANALLEEMLSRGSLAESGGILKSPDFAPTLTKQDREEADTVLKALRGAGMNPPAPSNLASEVGFSEVRVRALLKALKNVGDAIILDEKVVLASEVYTEAITKLHEAFSGKEFRMADVTKALGTSRKVAAPLLEHLDKQGVTVREGDERRFL